MTILILAMAGDPHAKLVEDVLTQKGHSFLRYEYSWFPEKTQVGVSISKQHGIRKVLRLADKIYGLDDFSAVWHRRPGIPEANHIEKPLKKYVISESRFFLEGLHYLTPQAFWLSNVGNERAAEFKVLQLIVAHELGFLLPDTVLGNDSESATLCVQRHGELALKPLAKALIELDLTFSQKIKKLFYEMRLQKFGLLQQNEHVISRPKYQSVITCLTHRFLQSEAEPYLEAINSCPVILQQYVPKKVELRITVVGKRIFSCAIYSQDSDVANQTDWRNDVYACRHTEWPLPKNIQNKCFDLLRRLGLQFGCIDMIVTPDGEYVFLEINPNGQWRWIQDLTGLPIAEAIADLLINKDGL